jgi:predicted amidohydrolase YtcJ
MVSEGNLAVRRALQAAENTVSSNRNSIDHVNTPDRRSRIEDMDSMTTSPSVQPCITPPISMIIIKFVFQSFSLLY